MLTTGLEAEGQPPVGAAVVGVLDLVVEAVRSQRLAGAFAVAGQCRVGHPPGPLRVSRHSSQRCQVVNSGVGRFVTGVGKRRADDRPGAPVGLEPPGVGRCGWEDADCGGGFVVCWGYVADALGSPLGLPPVEADRVCTVDDAQSEVAGVQCRLLCRVRCRVPQRRPVFVAGDHLPSVR